MLNFIFSGRGMSGIECGSSPIEWVMSHVHDEHRKLTCSSVLECSVRGSVMQYLSVLQCVEWVMSHPYVTNIESSRFELVFIRQLVYIWRWHTWLRHAATHRNTPQHTVAHCNTPQHTATHSWVGVYSMTWSIFDVDIRDYATQQHTATHSHPLQHTATHRNTHLSWCV